jgi:hypothetical protein
VVDARNVVTATSGTTMKLTMSPGSRRCDGVRISDTSRLFGRNAE